MPSFASTRASEAQSPEPAPTMRRGIEFDIGHGEIRFVPRCEAKLARRWTDRDGTLSDRARPAILVVGLLWPYLSKLGLGRLPGDIVIERENGTVYVPLATCLFLSLLLSLVFWVANR